MTLESIKWFRLKELCPINVQDLGTLKRKKKEILAPVKGKLHESIRFGQNVENKFFKSNNNMFESKQVSGKEMESYGGHKDEEASNGREEVMGNMSKACVTWLSAALRKLRIFSNWFSCTNSKRTRRVHFMVIYI